MVAPWARRHTCSSRCSSTSSAARAVSPAGQRVPDGVVGQAVLGRTTPPPRGAAPARRSRVLGLQVGAQQIGEQVVVAPPPPLLVQRDQEQAGPLDRLQQLLAVGAAHHGVAERAAEPVEDRRLQQERAAARRAGRSSTSSVR